MPTSSHYVTRAIRIILGNSASREIKLRPGSDAVVHMTQIELMGSVASESIRKGWYFELG